MLARPKKDPVAEFTRALRQGENPSIEEFLKRYPRQDLHQLREELEGARVLFWGATVPHVSDHRLEEVLQRLREAQERAGQKRDLETKVRELRSDHVFSISEMVQGLTERVGLTLKKPTTAAEVSYAARFRGEEGKTKDLAARAYGVIRKKQATDVAQDLLQKSLIVEPPVDLSVISDLVGAVVIHAPLGDCEGCTLQFEEGIVIYVNASPANVMRRRFTWGHELGHAVLHPQQPQWTDTYDMIHAIRAKRQRTQEAEANNFASELLTPKPMLEADRFPQSEVDFDTVAQIAERYQVSITSAAIRLIKITDHSAALYSVEDDQIIWGIPSEYYGMPCLKGAIHPHSALSEGGRDREYYVESLLEAWTWAETDEPVLEIGQSIGPGRWLVLVVRE